MLHSEFEKAQESQKERCSGKESEPLGTLAQRPEKAHSLLIHRHA